MRESTREFLKGISEETHRRDIEIDPEKWEEFSKSQKTFEQFQEERKAAADEEEARRYRAIHNERTPEEDKTYEAGLKELLGGMGLDEHKKEAEVRMTKLMDRIENGLRKEKTSGVIDSLLGSEHEHAEFLAKRIEWATENGNQELIQKYKKEKAEVDKNIAFYLSQYE